MCQDLKPHSRLTLSPLQHLLKVLTIGVLAGPAAVPSVRLVHSYGVPSFSNWISKIILVLVYRTLDFHVVEKLYQVHCTLQDRERYCRFFGRSNEAAYALYSKTSSSILTSTSENVSDGSVGIPLGTGCLLELCTSTTLKVCPGFGVNVMPALVSLITRISQNSSAVRMFGAPNNCLACGAQCTLPSSYLTASPRGKGRGHGEQSRRDTAEMQKFVAVHRFLTCTSTGSSSSKSMNTVCSLK